MEECEAATTAQPEVWLTPREAEILSLVMIDGQRRESKVVASNLSVSLRTVGFHLNNIYRKLGVRRFEDAFITAQERGITVADGRKMRWHKKNKPHEQPRQGG